MNYKTTVDNIDFVLDEKLFENELNRLLMKYKYSNNCFLSLIILDNNDIREYLVKRLKESINDLCPLDFNTENIKLNEISRRIKQDKKPVIAYNLENYYFKIGNEYDRVAKGVSGEIYYSEFKEQFTDVQEMGKYLVYTGINMARDGVFLKYSAVFFLVLSDDDYLDFISDKADDFASYCQAKEDFNSCFISEDNISLSEYLINKKISPIIKNKKKLV